MIIQPVPRKALLMSLGGGIEFITTAHVQGQGSTVTIDRPTGTANGDLLLAMLSRGTNSPITWTPPGGWSEVLDQGADPSLGVAHRTAGSSEPASYDFTPSSTGGGSNRGGAIAAFRGAAYSLIGSVATQSGTTSFNLPSITMPEGGLLVAFVSSSSTNRSFATPSGMTPILQLTSGTPALHVFIEEVDAGATGVRATNANNSGTHGGVLIGLIPA